MRKRTVGSSSRGRPSLQPARTSEPRHEVEGDAVTGLLFWVSWITCSRWRLATVLVAFRVCSALLCQTAFVPDEYWQSLEVAHRMVFGYGYLTWEWQKAIRGYTHPLIFAILYRLLASLWLDWPILLVVFPKILHAVVGAVGDVYVLKTATLLFGLKVGLCALLCNLSSWFLFYCLPRSLTNSLETILFSPLLYYWLKSMHTTNMQEWNRSTSIYLSLAAFSFLIRPTGVLLSLPLVAAQLWRQSSKWKAVFFHCTAIGTLALLWSVAVDWYFYGKPVLVQWNFFVFNALEGNSALFGTHPWHWYLSQGVPAVLFTLLPLFLLGVWLAPPSGRGLVWLAGWLVLSHSLLAHKEFRFIMALLPLSSLYSGYALHWILMLKSQRVLCWCSYALLLANLPMALWFSLVHQRGTLDVMTHLQSNIEANSSILFLMPCHSTPFYSHIHKDISMGFLECPPDGADDVEQFYLNPEAWLTDKYSTAAAVNIGTISRPTLPSHLVMFNSLVQSIKTFLEGNDYNEAVRFFHTPHPVEDTHGTHVLVYTRQPSNSTPPIS